MAQPPKVDLSKAVDVDWSSEKEYWNEYKLEDGTTLKIKLVLRGVKRTYANNPDGSPVYVINAQNVVRISKVPKKLLKKPKKSTMKPV